jgi:hypothetical protein
MHRVIRTCLFAPAQWLGRPGGLARGNPTARPEPGDAL